VPINTLAYANLPAGKSNNASALINLFRNLGGSVGISVATTLLARRAQVHQDRLVTHLTTTARPFQSQLGEIARRFQTFGADSATASQRALASVANILHRQSQVFAYLDTFIVLMCFCFGAALLTLFLKKIDLKNSSAH
jgi:DHA2 family multidrug resistance protein